jgi:hypothetical protein
MSDNEQSSYTINGWIPTVPVSTEVEAASREEAEELGREQLEAEHGNVDIDEVIEWGT